MIDCPLPRDSRVIGYLRVSSEAQKEKGTIAGQQQELQIYIETHGLVLVHPPFVDEAKPGSSTAPRDAFQDMIEFAHQEPRPCDGIIFWSWARFARDQDDAHFFKADLRRRGYTLISLSDGIPQATGFDYVMESLVHWKDEQYLRQLSRNVRRGLYLLARQGYPHGGLPPRGYERERIEVEIGGKKRKVSHWIPDPQWAPLVRDAWEMRANGASYPEILDATSLYPGTDRLCFHFRNKVYLGYRTYGDVEIPNAHEPLITQELWDRVQATLYERPARGSPWPKRLHPRQVNSPYLLSGLGRCAYCGANMTGKTDDTRRHPNYRYYLCSTKNSRGYNKCENKAIAAKRLEPAVLDVMLNRLLTPEFLAGLLEEVNMQLSKDDSESRMKQLGGRIRTLDRAMANLLDLAEKAGGTEEVLTRLELRRQEKQKLQQEAKLLEQRKPIHITKELLADLLAELREPLANGTLQAQQKVLRNVIDHIVVEPHKGQLYYRSPHTVLYARAVGSGQDSTRGLPEPGRARTSPSS